MSVLCESGKGELFESFLSVFITLRVRRTETWTEIEITVAGYNFLFRSRRIRCAISRFPLPSGQEAAH